ncbi:hypothetical protein, partial [Aeromonas rivipollensis]|uniref:hypothetical protein n=1 Tax=Aeromonas rivipollensis TaxID=948519 RepID=UPI003D23B4D4
MSINVGEVIAVRGTQVTLRIYEESSLETLFYDGKKYKGVANSTSKCNSRLKIRLLSEVRQKPP